MIAQLVQAALCLIQHGEATRACLRCRDCGRCMYHSNPCVGAVRGALRALVEAHDQEPSMLTEAEWERARAALRSGR